MGQLGIGKEGISLVPVQTLDLSDVVAVASGDYHSLAIKSDGTAWSWGNNYNG
jgi:alpha-tubulin suppressor-like RCC1 family protein